MTALRERLAEAMHGIEDICVRYANGGCRHLEYADALIAALGDDAARLEAALAPDAVVVTVEELARRMCEPTTHHAGRWDGAIEDERETYLDMARTLLGIDGGQ